MIEFNDREEFVSDLENWLFGSMNQLGSNEKVDLEIKLDGECTIGGNAKEFKITIERLEEVE